MSDSVRPHRRQPTTFPGPWDSPGKNTGVGCHFLLQCMKVKREREVAQSCLTLSDPMDCSLPGSSIHGIFQAGVLEWGAIAFCTPYNAWCLKVFTGWFLQTWKRRKFLHNIKYVFQKLRRYFISRGKFIPKTKTKAITQERAHIDRCC